MNSSGSSRRKNKSFSLLVFLLISYIAIYLGAVVGCGAFFLRSMPEPATEMHVYAEAEEMKACAEINDAEATRLAETYLSLGTYSKKGLQKELETREFLPEKQAKETVEKLEENWAENAKQEAERLAKHIEFNRLMVIGTLKKEGYTEEEIANAVK